MVLYKRKPIVLPDPKPLPSNLDMFVWHIEETGEWFLSYEEYLQRLDFYTRHHFTCEITGASCLTFFEALDSEESQFKYVEEKFPLKLREPVARYLHFNTIRRLDGLVEKVYSNFKTDFFPGETVHLRRNKENMDSSTTSQQGTPQPSNLAPSDVSSPLTDSQPHYQRPYIIKEKVQFNAVINPNTKEVIAPGHAKYMLVEDEAPNSNTSNSSNKSFVADESQIYRDRSTFTKHLIKCFFKITLQRASTKMGAPWCVKPEYLQMYGLTMDWPAELLRFKDDEPTNDPTPSHEQSDNADSLSKNGNYANVEFEDSPATPSSYYNESMSGHITDEMAKKSKAEKKRKEKPANESSPDYEEDDSKPNKKRKTDTGSQMITESELDSRASSNPPDASTPVVLRSIVNDMDIPYRGRPPVFLSDLSYYNKLLESVPVMEEKSPDRSTISNFDKLLQIYQFINTFNQTLCISYFNLDQFITTLKCTDPIDSQGEVVSVTLLNESPSNDTDETNITESRCQRNPKIRKLIEDKNMLNKDVKYTIRNEEPATDDIIDNFNGNGSGLIIEIFVALLRLFINENGDWRIVLMEDWIPEPIDIREQELGVTPSGVHDIKKDDTKPEVIKEEIDGKSATTVDVKQEEDSTVQESSTNQPNGKSTGVTSGNEKITTDGESNLSKDGVVDIEINHNDDSEETEETDEEFENLIDRILNFRNQEWTERLTKRQFNNSNWLIILLGIFEDSLAVPKYTEFLTYFKKTLVTRDISMTQLPKALWRNFCRNFSLEDKVTALWVLVDIISNFSPDIKNAIETSMEVCMHIRSERFKIFKDIKAVTTDLRAIDKEKNPEDHKAKDMQLQKLQEDKTDLDKKLMENDFQRLKPLGMDRYCNRYFWFDLTGVPNNPFSEDQTEHHNGRLWVRGPNTHCIRKFLKLEDEQITEWRQLCKIKGTALGTKEIFGVYRSDNGSYHYIDPITKEETELVSEDGQVNTAVNLTPIQRKIIDETPECLLLERNKWYYIENNEYLDSLLEWLDVWGRREHDLLRQFKPIVNRLKDVISIRNNCQKPKLNDKELEYIKELEDYTLSENELNLEKSAQDTSSTANKAKQDEIASTNKAEQDENVELDDIENKLEGIVNEIMNLDDGSKTRKVLNAISELEHQRDVLLEKKERLLEGSGPGGRIVARAEKNRIRHSRDNKLTRQEEVLSSLINLRHFGDIESAKVWKNHIAIEKYGSELRKNANKGKKGSQKKK